MKNDSVVLIVANYDDSGQRSGVDTFITRAVNNRFKLEGVFSNPEFEQMQLGGLRSRKTVPFYLEKGKIEMDGNIDSVYHFSVAGTPTNNEYTKAQQYLSPIYERRSALSQELRKLKEGTEAFESMEKEYGKKNDSINSFKIRFMESNPTSNLTFSYLYVLQDNLTTNEVEKIYNKLPHELKTSSMGRYIYTKLQANKAVAIGNKALDFTSADAEGRPVKLSDFQGKYILLEFWASWCVPCRAQSPDLVKIHETYKDKGFTILQYSVDVKRDEQKWRDAIRKDGLVWTQISGLTGPSDLVSEMYGVQPIPDNFLISPDGVILGRRLHPKELGEKLSRLLDK